MSVKSIQTLPMLSFKILFQDPFPVEGLKILTSGTDDEWTDRWTQEATKIVAPGSGQGTKNMLKWTFSMASS